MTMLGEIGLDFPDTPLEIRTKSDLTFDIQVYEEDGVTPIPLSAASGVVVGSFEKGDVVLDLAPEIDGTNPNILHVAVPASVTATLGAPWVGKWGVRATAVSSGENKLRVAGTATITAGA